MGRERRRFERVDSLVNVNYVSEDAQINNRSLTKDISEGGLSIPSNNKLPSGARMNVTIIIPDKKGEEKISAVTKVAWSRRNMEQWKPRYSAGLEFLDIQPFDRERLLRYASENRWIKSDFERALEEDKVPVLGRRGEFLI